MPNIKAIHQLVVNGAKASDPSRVIEPGKIVEVSKEDADRFIELGAAEAVTVAEAKAEAKKADDKKANDNDGLV